MYELDLAHCDYTHLLKKCATFQRPFGVRIWVIDLQIAPTKSTKSEPAALISPGTYLVDKGNRNYKYSVLRA